MAIDYKSALVQLLKYDVGRTAYFDVDITSPTGTTGNMFSFVDSRKMSFLCHSAELPGESTATVSQKIYGVVEKHSIMTSYNDINLSFYTIGSEIEDVRKTFLTWITRITGRGSVINGKSTTYNVGYKDDYISTIVITHYDATGKPLLKCKLTEAFPIAISQVPLAWSAENQAISFNVTFAYTEYEYDFLSPQPISTTLSQQPIPSTLSSQISNSMDASVSFKSLDLSFLQ